VFEFPVTLAVKVCMVPTDTAALVGDTDTDVEVELLPAFPDPEPDPEEDDDDDDAEDDPKTFSVALLLVALPALFVTITENNERLIAVVAGGVVYEEKFAPLIVFPFISHW
jgi:hypothetical protein